MYYSATILKMAGIHFLIFFFFFFFFFFSFFDLYSTTFSSLSILGFQSDTLAIAFSTAVAFANMIFTIVGMYLIDKKGRRKVMRDLYKFLSFLNFLRKKE